MSAVEACALAAVAHVILALVLTAGLLRARRRAKAELTQRHHAEHALRALNESLENQVAQRTAELQNIIEGLESFNRSVSHDLRGPLGGIASLSRMATRSLEHGDDDAVHRILPLIAGQAESLAQLVDSLLTLARVSDAELSREPVDLNALVRDTMDELGHGEPHVMRLPVHVSPMPMVHADPALLKQVFVNLVGNALKFSRDVTHPRVEVGSYVDNGRSAFFVRDNGVGFDAGQARRLFQPFQRLHGQSFHGHGVGLTIVRRVVERHGGRLWVRSQPGQGATFLFTLAPCPGRAFEAKSPFGAADHLSYTQQSHTARATGHH